jgi:hypothetical protein
MMLFEEHHMWKVMIWFAGSSPIFPSNLGMSEGSLIAIASHVGSCNIGSFMRFIRSGMLRDAKYGIWSGGGGLVPTMV